MMGLVLNLVIQSSRRSEAGLKMRILQEGTWCLSSICIKTMVNSKSLMGGVGGRLEPGAGMAGKIQQKEGTNGFKMGGQ